MPPGPKSKVQQKFAFEGMSDSEEEFDQRDAHIDSGYEGYDQKDDQRAPKQQKQGFLIDTDASSRRKPGNQMIDVKKPDQIQRRSQYGNLEIDLEQSSGDQFMMQSQKLPDMKQYYGLN